MNPFLALVLVAASDSAAGKGIDPTWVDKARSALPDLIERRLQLSLRLDEVHDYSAKADSGAQGKSAVRFREQTAVNETSRLGNNVLVKSRTKSDGEGRQEEQVLCRNPHYTFKLTRRGADGKYVLVSYSSDPPKGDFDRSAHRYMIQQMQGLLFAIESKERHSLRRLTWDAERSLVVVEYDAMRDDPDPKRAVESRCLFDPARGWAPVEEVKKTWSGRSETRFEYGIDVEGCTFPSVIESKTSFQVTPAPPGHVIRHEIRTLRPTRTSERDYRLTAFGLPEPKDAPPLPRSGLPAYVYILAGSASCAVLAFTFRYLARRGGK